MIQKIKKIITWGLVFCMLFWVCFGIKIPYARADTEESAPSLQLKIAGQPKLGEETTLIAQASNFKFENDKQFTWCVGKKTYQSVLAGSEDMLIDKDGTLSNRYGTLENAGCGHIGKYGPGRGGCTGSDGIRIVGVTVNLYRTWNKDDNGNGIDDDWERRYFDGKLLDPGKEDEDADGDGYKWSDSFPEDDRETGCGGMDIGIGEEKDFCNKGCKHQHCGCRAGAPCVRRSPKTGRLNVTGDGKFTNYEEYVFGTNPRNPDTDNDGVIDERDVLGIEGNTAKIKLDSKYFKIGDKIPVGVTVYGQKTKGFSWKNLKRIATGAAIGAAWGGVVGGLIGGLVGLFIGWLIDKDFNYIPLIAAEYIVASPGPPLRAVLLADPEVPTPENTGEEGAYSKVKVTAQVSGPEDMARVYYKWLIGTTVRLEGYGKSEFEFPVTTSYCGKVPIICDVQDVETGRMGSADLELTVGENITEEKLHAELVGTRAAEEGPVEDPCGPNMDVDGGFVRVGDIIKVQADLDLCKTCPPDCPEKYPDSDEAKDFIYQWYLDGKEQVDQSGEEKKDFTFTVTKSPGDEHLVKVKLIRISDGFEYGQLGEKVFAVQTPTAPISTPELGQPGSCDEIGSGGVCRVILEPNETQTVGLKTVLENFQPTYAPSFRYTWTFDGEVPRDPVTDEVIGVACGGEINNEEGYCESLTAESTLTYEFSHPGEITEGTVETHTVGLTVENYITATGGPHETATDTYAVEVVLKPAGGGSRGPVTRLFAQAGQTISSYFKNIFNVVLSIGIIGFIVFVVMAAGEVRRKK